MPTPEDQRGRETFAISSQAAGELSNMYAWYQRHLYDSGNTPNDPQSRFGPRLLRIARTTTNAAHPTYPTRPANTFVVEFGKTSFTATPGLRNLTFTPYTPAYTRVARDLRCNYHPQGSIVLCFLNHDQWHILPLQEEYLATALLNQDLCGETTGVMVTQSQTLPACIDFTPATVTNPRKHRGKSGFEVLMVKRQCSQSEGECGSTEQWQILDVQLREYCAVVGIKDQTDCLVAPGLKLAGEWCPADEPTTACLIVDYTRCSGSDGSCNTAWSFSPLFACCGQGSGSG